MDSAEQQSIETAKRQLAEAHEMIALLKLNEALRQLNYLARQDHPGLEEIRATAQELIPEVNAQRDAFTQRAMVHLERAEILLKELQFHQAITELNHIPAPLRDRSARQLLEQAASACEEIEQLKQQLLRRDGVMFRDRMTAIQRLQELQPDDPQVQNWANQIHDHILGTATKKIRSYCYRESAELLRSVPTTLRSEKIQKLQRHADELEYLDSEVQLAPTVAPASLEAAKRLVRIDEGNQAARAALQKMQATRAKANSGNSAAPFAEWTPCPDQPHIGLPIHTCRQPQRLRCASPDIEGRLQQYPGQFLVACGLALQALGRAAVPTNLIPAAKQGVLGRLRTLRERPIHSAWGLDLSNTSLKAIQLTVGDDDQLRVTQCVYIAHRLHLTHPDAATAGKSILLDSLGNFTSQCPLQTTDRVAAQWPGIQSLVRYVAVPPASDKKIREIVQLEAQRQIPFPLAEVCWDAFRFPTAQTDLSGSGQQVLLIAARRGDLESRLELLREGGINVNIMQCDALALHNFVHHEFLGGASQLDDRTERGPTAATGSAGVAALDVGSDATAIVFSFPDFVWFRVARPAGDDLTMGLARRFKITRDVAERVKHDPTKAKRMGELYEEASVVFRKITDQFDTALVDLEKVASGKRADQLLLAGGGGQTHGLLRFLRFGR